MNTQLLRVSTLGLSLLLAATSVAQDGGAKPPATNSAQATPAAKAESPLLGKFTSAVTEPEKQVRQKSVDQAVSEIFFALRGMGRKRVEAKTHIPAWVEIKQSGQTVTFHFEGRQPEPCPLQGSTKGKDPDGKEAEFSARQEGQKLIQTVKTEDGQRTNVFVPQADGSMKLNVELKSERFKTPIRYTISYKRQK